MTDPNPLNAPPLTLPRAALNAPSEVAHPDSEEARQHGRHRVAQELHSVRPNAPRTTTTSSHQSPSLRARGTQCATAGLQQRSSRASTAVDSLDRENEHAVNQNARGQPVRWYEPVVRFWKRQIDVVIEEGDPRDYLALERTFLAYLRTSLALAMTGVVTAQLFRLQHSINPDPEIGFYVIGVPVAASFIAIGMVVLLIGAYRFWRQQQAIIRGKVIARGWEIMVISLLCTLIVVGLLALAVAIDVEKGRRPLRAGVQLTRLCR